MKKLLIYTILVLFFAVSGYATLAVAATAGTVAPCTTCNLTYQPLEPLLPPNSTASLTDPNSLPGILNVIFTILITVGALLAVLMLTIGGIQYMTSGTAGGKNVGMKRAQAALWGIVLIAGSWLILNTINPKLLNFTLNPCTQDMQQQGLCTVTANNASTNNLQTTQTNNACGGSYPDGCGANQYCGTYSTAFGSNTTCLSDVNQTANTECTDIGGVWYSSLTSTYCSFPWYTTQESCSQAGHKWSLYGTCYQ
jgi:hypothetical protein